VTDIVVYRRRLVGKQTVQSSGTGFRCRGHYDVLGVKRSATSAEIHAAYRRCALSTHPDKGGDPADFRRVVAAFEELADEVRRASYNRSLDLFGRKDGSGINGVAEAQGSARHDAKYGEARVTHYSLLSSFDVDALLGMPAPALQALKELLEGKIFLRPTDTSSRASQGNKYISQHRSGYKVTVGWASLQLSTGFTKCLAQAIDWQIALLWLRSVAEARTKRRPSADPLTEDELFQVLQAEPSMELSFQMTLRVVGGKGKKVSTPIVQDLSLALELAHRLVSLKSTAPVALQRVKKEAEKAAVQNRKKRKACEQKLKAAVAQELQSRKRKRNDASRADCAPRASGETRLVVWRPKWRIVRKTPDAACTWTC